MTRATTHVAARVIKVGGRAQTDPQLPALLARAAADGFATIIVHGGGDEVSSLQRVMGSAPRFIDGLRVTSESDVDLLRMALSGTANKRLVSTLITHGVRAIGLSGEDGLLTARRVDDPRLGCVGAPSHVNLGLLHLLMNAGYVPVVSPLSRNGGGGPIVLNVNGDDAATAIALAVEATELLFVSDLPAVLDDGAPITRLDADSARDLLAAGTAHGGMRAKLHAALAALEGGVARVRICDPAGIVEHAAGTLLTHDHVMV